MTITSFDIYVITRLDDLRCWCGAFVGVYIALFAGLIIVTLVWSASINDEPTRKSSEAIGGFIRKFKPFVVLPVAVALMVLVPTTKEMAAIKVIPAIANSEIVQDKIPEALGGLIDLANDWMQELSPKKEEVVE